MGVSSGFCGKFEPPLTAVVIITKENGGIAPAVA
jgi:hypothetical protein